MFKGKFNFIGLALLPLVIGLAVGVAVPVDFIRNKIAESLGDSQDEEDAHPDHETAADVVHLTETAQEGIGIKTARLKVTDFQSRFEVPAFVREIPGASDMFVASRFEGLVKKVYVSEGQTIRSDQPLLDIELTGDQLATAQSELLDAQKQISLVNQEISRLDSIQGGGIAAKELIKTKYERDRLIAKVETKSQELLVRGLTQDQIDEIIKSKKLLRTITITVPGNLVPPQLNADEVMNEAPESFLVEKLNVKPGAIAGVGDSLCHLSYHAILVLEGQAYEKDLPQIRDAIEQNETVQLSVGPDGAQELIDGQHIAYVSNHVDNATNTYPFYVYVRNVPLYQKSSASGDYVVWKWKPGQRAHIGIPDQKFGPSVVVPRDAVAVDGLNHYVFRWNGAVVHEHDESGPSHIPHDEMVSEDEYQGIEVILLYMDQSVAVIQLANDLKIGDRIAINHASQLLFGMQAGSGGGGNSHGHNH